MSKNLKLKKVNKSFVPEPISRVFRIPYLYFTYTYLGRMFLDVDLNILQTNVVMKCINIHYEEKS